MIRSLPRILSLVVVVSGLLLIIASTSSRGQTQGILALSTQPDVTCVSLFDDFPAIRTVYVIHTLNFGSTASRFRVEPGPGLNVTYMSESHPFASTIGDAVGGVSVCYGGACIVGDQVVLSITYMTYGTSTSCAKLLLKPHPSAITVEAMSCGQTPLRTFVQDLYARPGCGCPDPRVVAGAPTVFDCTPVSVSQTTWGAIKALYAN